MLLKVTSDRRMKAFLVDEGGGDADLPLVGRFSVRFEGEVMARDAG